jgi:galactokinase
MNGHSQLSERAADCFVDAFNADPESMARAPGRINLLGEHVDYNGGVVLPMGIARSTIVAVARNSLVPTVHRFVSDSLQRRAEYQPDRDRLVGTRPWWAHLAGVIAQFAVRTPGNHPKPERHRWQQANQSGFDIAIASDLPIGGGLSSSAALTVALAKALDALLNTDLRAIEIAEICRTAEQEFAGVPCGIMDPLCIATCTAGHCVRLDCQSGSVESIPIQTEQIGFLVADTGVHRKLNAEGYGTRRRECETAARKIGIPLLADLAVDQLDGFDDVLSEHLLRRTRHVVHEIDRVRRGERALRQRRWTEFGDLMNESHESLRDLFEVSCPELDAMVQTANALEGVFGSRMTGAGFGGCTIHLVDRRLAAQISSKLASGYARQTGIQPEIFLSAPSGGAERIVRRPASRGLTPNG